MPNIYNAGQLLTIIRNLGQNDIPDLGSTDDAQNDAIYQLINVAMMRNARLANQVKYSDSKTISADGFVTFQQDATDISNMFEPKIIFGPNSRPITKRTADDAPIGWWRESENNEIHIRGFSGAPPLTAGSYQLKYIKYPKLVTLDTDTIEFPPSGYDALIKDVLSLVKLARNSYAGAEQMDAKAKQAYGVLGQASTNASGTGSSGQPVGPVDVQTARGQ